MKKPNTLNLKEKSIRRSKAVHSDFEKRKEDYSKLKQLRQKLKLKKNERIDAVK
jgi:hypothetical protein